MTTLEILENCRKTASEYRVRLKEVQKAQAKAVDPAEQRTLYVREQDLKAGLVNLSYAISELKRYEVRKSETKVNRKLPISERQRDTRRLPEMAPTALRAKHERRTDRKTASLFDICYQRGFNGTSTESNH